MKKFMTLALSFLFLFSVVGCNNKDKNVTENKNKAADEATDKIADDAYYNTYTGLYDENIGTLGQYAMYTDVNSVNNAYKDKKYPGNEEYLNDVKAAYKDSKQKIQTFVNGLKNDAKTEDNELKKMNDDLIAEGERTIKDIDARMARLDNVTEQDYSKTQDEFIKLVDDTVRKGEKATNTFTDMLKDMDTKLKINRGTKQ